MSQLPEKKNQPFRLTFSTSFELSNIPSTATGLREDLLSIKTVADKPTGAITIRSGREDRLISNKPIFACSKTQSGSLTTFSALIDEMDTPPNKLHNYSDNSSLIAKRHSQDFLARQAFAALTCQRI